MSKKTTSDYIDELKDMVKQANDGKDCAPWLVPMLRSTAMNMVILDKLQDDIAKSDLTTSMTGSMGQQKIEVNPLLEKYYKAQEILMRQFDKLGLTAKSSQSDTGKDPMADWLNDAKM